MAWLTGWTYRKSVSLSRPSGAVTNYQMKLLVGESAGATGEDVDCNSHVQTDFDDLRFTAVDGTTLLDYWIESITEETPNQLATVWIEFDSIGTGATTFYMYYGFSNISDPSTVFGRSRNSPVLSVGAAGTWDDFWVMIHSIWKEGSTYYAYYNGRRSSTQMQVGLATSTDGITWTKEGTNPVLAFGAVGKWDDYVAGSPLVWKEGATWYMLFNGAPDSTSAVGIGLATSSDGISWTRYDVNNPVMTGGGAGSWDQMMTGPGNAILKEDSTYYLYYMGGSSRSGQTTWKIGLATSTDLHTWTKSGNNPLLSSSGLELNVMEPFVKKFGSTYSMYYQYLTNNSGRGITKIGLATSATKDADWSKSGSNPIIDNMALDWDSQWAESPVLIQVDNIWRLYYSSLGDQGSNAIIQTGYANANMSNGAIGVNTFPEFDHFNSGSIRTSWASNGTPTEAASILTLDAASEGIKSVATYQYKRFRARINFPAVNDAAYRNWAGFSNVFDQTNVEMAVVTPIGGATTLIYNANYLSAYDSASLGAYSGSRIWEIRRFSNAVDYYLDAALVRHVTTANTIPSASLSAKLMAAITTNYKGPFTVDWVFVANLDAIEPAWGAWGSEEAAESPPSGVSFVAWIN